MIVGIGAWVRAFKGGDHLSNLKVEDLANGKRLGKSLSNLFVNGINWKAKALQDLWSAYCVNQKSRPSGND